ncbi:MAG: non-ribosomal peptide synthetase [Caulobacteraceae bacterium]
MIDKIVEVADRWPRSAAIQCRNSQITYGDLLAAADELAAELLRTGAEPGAPVAVCIDRSAEHLAALLATWRAGLAFLPLDPGWPAERIRRVLDDADVLAVVADERWRAAVAGPHRTVLSSALRERRRVAARPRRTDGEEVAYVIYTSGSTGEPKGVEITHANLAHLADWHREAFGVTARDRASWIAGLAFDASVWEIFPYLAAGASLHAPDERTRADAGALSRWLVEESISMAYVPTPLAEGMIRAEWPRDAALRYLLTGGDTLHVRPRAGLPFQVVNNYGPTECAVVATSGVVGADGVGLPSIGRPIGDARIHILDETGAAAPTGAVGEIHIGGPGVGRGYRGRPALTAERFVSVEGAGGVAERCYRTGDLGAWSEEGEIVFHGRCDAQIKHHGHRIEPDEVSAALARHPLVAQSAIVAEGEGADGQLVAYVVLRSGKAARGDELRDFLALSLPPYMLPSVFVRLGALPMTANGKVDRQALPSPTSSNSLPNAPYRPPQSPAERRIAAMVGELLEIDSVGLDDNFFMLGGHSLLGAQLLLRLQEAFGAELALRDLFESQTIQNLAARVERAVEKVVASMSEDEVRERLAPAQ